MNTRTVYYTPDIPLEIDSLPAVPIKGQQLRHRLDSSICELYEDTPSLTTVAAVEEIRRLVDQWASRWEHPVFNLPALHPGPDAQEILNAWLDPTSVPFAPNSRSVRPSILELDSSHSLPYQLGAAPRSKLIHDLAWVQSNVQCQLEAALSPLDPNDQKTKEAVVSALRIYCLLCKMNSYHLARNMSINHAMFAQDRIVSLFSPLRTFDKDDEPSSVSRVANDIALATLERLGTRPPAELCRLAVHMGTVWVNAENTQQLYLIEPEQVLADIFEELVTRENRLEVDHVDNFLARCSNGVSELMMVLDDNGESVFDLALAQTLLAIQRQLRITLLINQHPVSTNICCNSLQRILENAQFARMRQYQAQGRLRIVYERQWVRSFEQAFLSSQSQQCLDQAELVYVKGCSFFETFQPLKKARLFAFVVNGPASEMLTGFRSGAGIFALLDRGISAYNYRSDEQIQTLRDQTERPAVGRRYV